MILIIKQLVIKGEVVADLGQEEDKELNLNLIREMIEEAKKEIERDCEDRIVELMENHSIR